MTGKVEFERARTDDAWNIFLSHPGVNTLYIVNGVYEDHHRH